MEKSMVSGFDFPLNQSIDNGKHGMSMEFSMKIIKMAQSK